MKKIGLLALFLSIAPVVVGEVSTSVYLADGNTPFLPIDPNFPHIYPDIMVGTRLTIIVDSNLAEDWWGGLAVVDANRDYGLLSGRDFNEITHDWEGSRFPAAGVDARVWDWEEDPGIDGFTLYTGYTGIEAGDWFILDYNAINIGACNVEFYKWVESYKMFVHDPNRDLSFTHVRTRDFNTDTKVDFIDFAILASYWQVVGCNDPNWCEGTDLDIDGDVDPNDLGLFVNYWLKRTQ
jgi:hypothetical protein